MVVGQQTLYQSLQVVAQLEIVGYLTMAQNIGIGWNYP
jgi:bacteriorhodopsin